MALSSTRFPITLLHLTDLHFGDPAKKGHFWNSESPELGLAAHNQRGLLGSLVRDLRAQKSQPDLILVTGDLLDRCDPAGARLVVSFLTDLIKELTLERARVVLIPGNHDVQRDPNPAKNYALFGDIWNQFYGTSRPAFDPTLPPHRRVEHFDFARDIGLEVVGFNSCEELDHTTKQEHGSVKTGQRDHAEALLAASDGRGLFRVALMHHHLESPVGIVRNDYSVMDDALATIEWLVHKRFQLALHGHQHVDWQSIREIDDWTLSVAAGASGGVASYGRAHWNLHLGYQLIVIESATEGRRIRREYDLQRREWLAAGHGDADQKLRFGQCSAKGVRTTGSDARSIGDISIENAKSRAGGLTAEAANDGNIGIKHVEVEKDLVARTGVRDPKA